MGFPVGHKAPPPGQQSQYSGARDRFGLPIYGTPPTPARAPQRPAAAVKAAPKSKEVKASPKGAPAPQAPASNPINDRYGNDMAWLDPTFEQHAAQLGRSAGSQVYADPRDIAAQNDALDHMMGIANGGGATAMERARRQAARSSSEDWLRGQREADTQSLRERGMGGSGAELLTVGNDRQAAAQRNSAADLETDAALEKRALDATMASSSMASGMRGQSADEGFKRADAADSFAALNQNAVNAVQGANTKFKQDAWQRMINNRNEWDSQNLQLGLSTAGNMLGSDVRENAGGYDYAGNLAKSDASAANAAQGEHNSAYLNPVANGTGTQNALNQITNQGTAQAFGQAGAAGDSVINTVGTVAGGAPGAATGSGTTPPKKQDDQTFLGGF